MGKRPQLWLCLLLACLLIFALFGKNAFLKAGGIAIFISAIYELCKCMGNQAPKPKTVLFVYGTLKRNFHWHSKFLSNAEYLGTAVTEQCYPLVVGDCGVPYLLDLPGEGKNIEGELFRVTSEDLENMDQYEGVGKGHYGRKR